MVKIMKNSPRNAPQKFNAGGGGISKNKARKQQRYSGNNFQKDTDNSLRNAPQKFNAGGGGISKNKTRKQQRYGGNNFQKGTDNQHKVTPFQKQNKPFKFDGSKNKNFSKGDNKFIKREAIEKEEPIESKNVKPYEKRSIDDSDDEDNFIDSEASEGEETDSDVDSGDDGGQMESFDECSDEGEDSEEGEGTDDESGEELDFGEEEDGTDDESGEELDIGESGDEAGSEELEEEEDDDEEMEEEEEGDEEMEEEEEEGSEEMEEEGSDEEEEERGNIYDEFLLEDEIPKSKPTRKPVVKPEVKSKSEAKAKPEAKVKPEAKNKQGQTEFVAMIRGIPKSVSVEEVKEALRKKINTKKVVNVVLSAKRRKSLGLTRAFIYLTDADAQKDVISHNYDIDGKTYSAEIGSGANREKRLAVFIPWLSFQVTEEDVKKALEKDTGRGKIVRIKQKARRGKDARNLLVDVADKAALQAIVDREYYKVNDVQFFVREGTECGDLVVAYRVVYSGIPENTTIEQLKKAVESVIGNGSIQSASFSFKSNKFAFIRFHNAEQQKKALLDTTKVKIGDIELKVAPFHSDRPDDKKKKGEKKKSSEMKKQEGKPQSDVARQKQKIKPQDVKSEGKSQVKGPQGGGTPQEKQQKQEPQNLVKAEPQKKEKQKGINQQKKFKAETLDDSGSDAQTKQKGINQQKKFKPKPLDVSSSGAQTKQKGIAINQQNKEDKKTFKFGNEQQKASLQKVQSGGGFNNKRKSDGDNEGPQKKQFKKETSGPAQQQQKKKQKGK